MIKKVKSSSLIEIIVAMVIISVIIGVCFGVINNLSNSKKSTRLKAIEVLNTELIEIKEAQEYYANNYEKDKFSIQVSIEPFSEGLIKLILVAELNGRRIHQIEEVVREI